MLQSDQRWSSGDDLSNKTILKTTHPHSDDQARISKQSVVRAPVLNFRENRCIMGFVPITELGSLNGFVPTRLITASCSFAEQAPYFNWTDDSRESIESWLGWVLGLQTSDASSAPITPLPSLPTSPTTNQHHSSESALTGQASKRAAGWCYPPSDCKLCAC